MDSLQGRAIGKNPTLMIVQDAPSTREFEDGMYGIKSTFLFAVIEKAMKKSLDPIYLTSLVPFKTVSNEPNKEELVEGRNALYEEIDRVKPECILCLGNAVYNVLFTDTEGSLVKNRSKILELKTKTGTFKSVVSYSPFYIEKSDSDNLLKSFAKDVELAYIVATGQYRDALTSNTVYCSTGSQIKELIGHIQEVGRCSFDFETTGLDVFAEDFAATGISFSFNHGSSFFIPLVHPESPFKEPDKLSIVLNALKAILEDPDIVKIAHNASFDYKVAWVNGIRIKGQIHDTMLMHHIFNEKIPHGLKPIVDEIWPEYGGYEEKVKQYKWSEIPMELLSPYAGTDTDLTLRLSTYLLNWLFDDMRLYRLYRNLVMFSFKGLCHASIRGMDIDNERLLGYIDEAQALIGEVEEGLRKIPEVMKFEKSTEGTVNRNMIKTLEQRIEKARAKYPKSRTEDTKTVQNYEKKIADIKSGAVKIYEGINFGSHKQLANLLYTSAGLSYDQPYVSAKRQNYPTTNKDYISHFDDYSGFIAGLQKWRSLAKTQSTYLKGIHERLDRQSKIHTSFLQHGTESGRLSSQNPNLQNLPNKDRVKDDENRKIVGYVKDVFVPPEDYYIVQVDYSQAELRIVADFAGEENMLQVYDEGGDIHMTTAASMYGEPIDKFKELEAKMIKDWRSKAKPVNFGLIYLMSPEALVDYAKNNYGVTMTQEEGMLYHRAFFKKYPKITHYHDLYIAKASKFGYVRTLYGRRRRTPDIDHPDDYLRGFDERIAVNSPVQGTAGEFTVFALGLLENRLCSRTIIVNTIHDSILFYIHKDDLNPELRKIRYTMENLPNERYFGKELKQAFMKVDVELSLRSWRDMEEYDIPD